ncbi:MAG: hypothetical protein U0V48_13285 [Anaerolineales bacterium]
MGDRRRDRANSCSHVGSARWESSAPKYRGRGNDHAGLRNDAACWAGAVIRAGRLVWFTEAQAKERGYNIKIGRFPFQANGKALGLAIMRAG